MTIQETSERAAGGLAGKIVGKAKQAAGSLVGNRDLADEGRLQRAQVDAEADAGERTAEAKQRQAAATLEADKTQTEIRRQLLQNDITAQERERQIEEDRQAGERKAKTQAQHQQAAAESARRAQESLASKAEDRAERDRLAAAEEAIRLEQQARRAETNAHTIDPEENR